MSKHRFTVDQKVRHNFSTEEVGYIIVTRQDPKGYDYCVEWLNGEKDWYREESLEAAL